MTYKRTFSNNEQEFRDVYLKSMEELGEKNLSLILKFINDVKDYGNGKVIISVTADDFLYITKELNN